MVLGKRSPLLLGFGLFSGAFWLVSVTVYSLKLTWHLKLDGWNTFSFPFRMAYFQVMLVPGRVSDGISFEIREYLICWEGSNTSFASASMSKEKDVLNFLIILPETNSQRPCK